MFFLRKSNLERLPVAMCGVRMGERTLQIGIDDSALAGAIAAKVGLSGHAAMALGDETSAARARAAAAAAGALVDVQITALHSLPFEADAFDLVVVHAAGSLPRLEDDAAVAMLRDAHRVLRHGGRIIVIEGSGRRGLGRWFGAAAAMPASPAIAALSAAGFRPARLLAEREGYRFTEGLKT